MSAADRAAEETRLAAEAERAEEEARVAAEAERAAADAHDDGRSQPATPPRRNAGHFPPPPPAYAAPEHTQRTNTHSGGTMHPDFKERLSKAGVDPKIIHYLDDPEFGLYSETEFASFILSPQEIQASILDHIPGMERALGQRGLLVKLWRQADAGEKVRLDRLARGVGSDDLEDPLPDGDHSGDVEKFNKAYGNDLDLTELLCEPLYARLKRECKRTLTGLSSDERHTHTQ